MRPSSVQTASITRWAWVAWLLLALLVVVPHVRSYTTLSPIDELQHADTAYKAGRLHLVREGEKVGEPTLREQSCRGIDSPGFVSPPCDAPVVLPEQYQEAGYNTAAVHPPNYYLATGLGARLLVATTGVDSEVTAARSLGALWLAAGLWLTWLLSRRLGAGPWNAAAGTALLAAAPVVVLSSTTVTPDATALLSGAVVTFVTVLHLQGGSRPWMLVAGAAAASGFKATGILAVGACVLALALAGRAWSREAWRPDGRSWLTGGGWLLLGGIVPVLLWTTIAGARALDVPPSPMSRFNVSSIGSSELVTNLLALLPPTQGPYLQPELRGVLLNALITVVGLLLLGGLMATALGTSGDRRVDAVGTAALLSMLVGGPLLVVLFFVTAGAYFPIPPRYGLPLLPLGAAVLGVLATRRPVVGTVLAGISLVQLVAYWTALRGGP